MLQYLLEGDSERPVMQVQEALLELTDDQINQSISVITVDYWNLQFWKCRHDVHSTFSFPYLSAVKRLYFHYRYFLFQVTSSPGIARYLEKSRQWRISKDKEKTGWLGKSSK